MNMFSKSTSYPHSHVEQRTEHQHEVRPEIALSDLWSENEETKKRAWAQANSAGKKAYDQSPGFFTRFRSYNEFGMTLAAPIAIPVVLGIVTAVAAIGAALSALAAVGSLLVAAGAGFVGIFNQNAKETAEDALGFAAVAGAAVAVCTIAAAAMAVLTAVLTPLALIQLITRSATTVVSPVLDCISDCATPDEEATSTLRL
jgi:hypothetical protein